MEIISIRSKTMSREEKTFLAILIVVSQGLGSANTVTGGLVAVLLTTVFGVVFIYLKSHKEQDDVWL